MIATLSFTAGALTMAGLVAIFPDKTAPAAAIIPVPPLVPLAASVAQDGSSAVDTSPVGELRARHLTLPVQGAATTDVKDTFNQKRGTTRRHEAIDVIAPRNTPVLAVEDGTVAKLFSSEAGGITLYQFDPSRRYAYYYAHLERYADGLAGGDQLKRGQVIGYVGTTGNAPKDTPHLHFGIFELTAEKLWWRGTPIDPFRVLR